MTNFNESKLSKLIARAIVVPADRAPLLALATPVYCPSNKGVRASKLQVINPSPITTYLQTKTITDGTAGEVETSTTETVIGGTKLVTKTITNVDHSTDTINYMDNFFSDGEQVDFSKDFDITFSYIYPASQSAGDEYCVFNYDDDESPEPGMYSNTIVIRVNATVANSNVGNVQLSVGSTKENATTNLFAQMNNPPLSVGSGFDFNFHWNAELQRFVMKITEHETGRLLYEGDRPGSSADGMKTENVQDESNYYIANTTSYSVSSPLLTRQDVSISSEFTPQDNIVDITLNKVLRRTYNVPYETELKTDVDLMNLIKSDILVQFKKAVNAEVINQVVANKGSISSVTFDTLQNTLGKLIADNITKGSGNRFSVYNYDNGAPVEYMTSSDELSFTDLISNRDASDTITFGELQSMYASINDVNTPAMFYFEKPSVILNSADFTGVQQGLVSGNIKTYLLEKVNVDVTSVDISTTIGKGIFGTNDAFAVGFTEPHIAVEPNTSDFSYTVAVEIYFGIALIHKENLEIINVGT